MDKAIPVLLIDDDDTDNAYHEQVIQKTGILTRLNSITDSRKAFEHLEQGCSVEDDSENPLPEFIFLDINMPVINGFELLDKLRKISDPYNRKKKMKIFILTTSVNPEHKSATKTYGDLIKGYLTKPLTSSMFLDVLENKS